MTHFLKDAAAVFGLLLCLAAILYAPLWVM